MSLHDNHVNHILTQPFVGVITGALALAGLAAAWAALPPVFTPSTYLMPTILAVALVVSVMLAYQFPIHIHYRLKVDLFSVPIYLLAVLLPVPLGVFAAGAGMLTAELTLQARRGMYPSDIATQTGRIMIAVLPASLVAHVPFGSGLWALGPLLGAALVLWLGETLTLPLVVAPITGEAPAALLRVYVREAGVVEGVQYILGILGALVYMQQPLALLFMLIPVMAVYRAFKSAKEMHDSTRAMLESMADIVDLRDPYTGGHSRRVAELCRGILEEMQIKSADADLIVTAARIHDIGKVAIPDYVLNKPGPLTPEERVLMETHAERGADLLLRYPDFARGAVIVRHHHEHWDGQGYPHRLRGTEIPLGARIIAVADSFDAMTSDRAYRPVMSPRQASDVLRAGRGRQWDGAIVDAFLRTIADRLEAPPAGRLRVVAPNSSTDPSSDTQARGA